MLRSTSQAEQFSCVVAMYVPISQSQTKETTMTQITTFTMVLVALFIWWAAIFHADAQGYYVDEYQTRQQRNDQYDNWYAQQQQQLQIQRQNQPITNPYNPCA